MTETLIDVERIREEAIDDFYIVAKEYPDSKFFDATDIGKMELYWDMGFGQFGSTNVTYRKNSIRDIIKNRMQGFDKKLFVLHEVLVKETGEFLYRLGEISEEDINLEKLFRQIDTIQELTLFGEYFKLNKTYSIVDGNFYKVRYKED